MIALMKEVCLQVLLSEHIAAVVSTLTNVALVAGTSQKLTSSTRIQLPHALLLLGILKIPSHLPLLAPGQQGMTHHHCLLLLHQYPQSVPTGVTPTPASVTVSVSHYTPHHAPSFGMVLIPITTTEQMHAGVEALFQSGASEKLTKR